MGSNKLIMKVENVVKYLKSELSRAFWQGKRWAVFNAIHPLIASKELMFYKDYCDASNFCAERIEAGQGYKIAVLADILRGLNQYGKERADRPGHLHIAALLNAYPVSGCVDTAVLTASLRLGNYCPIWWNTILNPIQAIEQYHIIAHRCYSNNSTAKTHAHTILYAYRDFPEGMIAFQEQVRKYARGAIECHDLLLVGRFYGNKLELSAEGMPRRNTGLLLFSCNLNLATKSKEQGLKVIQHHDPCESLQVRNGIFVRLDRTRKNLEFFNSRLQRTLPGMTKGELDLQYFSFGYPENMFTY